MKIVYVLIAVIILSIPAFGGDKQKKAAPQDSTSQWLNVKKELAGIEANLQKIQQDWYQKMILSPEWQQQSTYKQILLQFDADSIRIKKPIAPNQ